MRSYDYTGKRTPILIDHDAERAADKSPDALKALKYIMAHEFAHYALHHKGRVEDYGSLGVYDVPMATL